MGDSPLLAPGDCHNVGDDVGRIVGDDDGRSGGVVIVPGGSAFALATSSAMDPRAGGGRISAGGALYMTAASDVDADPDERTAAAVSRASLACCLAFFVGESSVSSGSRVCVGGCCNRAGAAAVVVEGVISEAGGGGLALGGGAFTGGGSRSLAPMGGAAAAVARFCAVPAMGRAFSTVGAAAALAPGGGGFAGSAALGSGLGMFAAGYFRTPPLDPSPFASIGLSCMVPRPFSALLPGAISSFEPAASAVSNRSLAFSSMFIALVSRAWVTDGVAMLRSSSSFHVGVVLPNA